MAGTLISEALLFTAAWTALFGAQRRARREIAARQSDDPAVLEGIT